MEQSYDKFRWLYCLSLYFLDVYMLTADCLVNDFHKNRVQMCRSVPLFKRDTIYVVWSFNINGANIDSVTFTFSMDGRIPS
jgi:hypothetical protein